MTTSNEHVANNQAKKRRDTRQEIADALGEPSTDDAVVESASLSSRSPNPDLQNMLERDARRHTAQQEFGNAIQKQKSKASREPLSTHSSPLVAEEYQYHVDRILVVGLCILLLLAVLGWTTYWFLSQSNDADQFADISGANLAVVDSVAEPAAMNDPTTAAAGVDASLQAPVQSQPAAQATAPQQPATQALPESEAQPSALAQADAPQATAAPAQPEQAAARASDDQANTGSVNDATTAAITANQAAVNDEPASASPSIDRGPASAQPSVPRATGEQRSDDAGSQSAQQPPAEPSPAVMQANQANLSKVGIIDEEKVARAALAENIVEREPSGVFEAQQLSLDGRDGFRVHYFTEFTNLQDQVASHTWYFNDRPMVTIDMAIGGPRWRASSNKQLDTSGVGQWRVEAKDGKGNVIARSVFELQP